MKTASATQNQNQTVETATFTAAAVSLITAAAQVAAPRALGFLSKKYVRGTLRGVVAAGAIECAYLGVKGDLTREKAVRVMGSTLSSWAAAEAGAVIGSIAGPVGALIGGVVGGAIGYSGFHSYFKE